VDTSVPERIQLVRSSGHLVTNKGSRVLSGSVLEQIIHSNWSRLYSGEQIPDSPGSRFPRVMGVIIMLRV
jgi:hypothetical protein